MSYMGTGINDSPVIALIAAEAIEDAAFKAVKLDENGNAVLAGEGEVPIGIITAEFDNISEGDDITVQIKDIGFAFAGEEIAVGAEVACGTDGKIKTAESGNFIIGFALEEAETDSIIRVQITKSGYMLAGESASTSDETQTDDSNV